jgi:hypothetical protein
MTSRQIWFILVADRSLVHLLDKIENKNPGLKVMQNIQFFSLPFGHVCQKKEYCDRTFLFKIYFSQFSEISHPKNAACVVQKEKKDLHCQF